MKIFIIKSIAQRVQRVKTSLINYLLIVKPDYKRVINCTSLPNLINFKLFPLRCDFIQFSLIFLSLFQFGVCFSKSENINGIPTFRTVGPGSNCNFNTINGATLQDALNSGPVELRLVNTVSYVGTFSAIGGITLRGGFDSCIDAVNDTQGLTQSVIDGDSISSTLTLAVNGSYTLEKISIINGLASEPAPGNAGGGLNLAAADLFILLDGVVIENNVAMLGAGIAKSNPNDNVLLIIVDSTIQNNHTLLPDGLGGGLYFDGLGEVIAYGDTLITRNEAETGGGLFFKDTTATLVVGQNSTDSGIIANHSTLSGGGVFTNSSTLEITGGTKNVPGIGLIGVSGKNYLIMENIADFDDNMSGVGGGFFIYNNSQVTLNAISIINNQAYDAGGGIYSYQGTTLDIGFPENSQCQVTAINGCNFFINNQADVIGGAFYATNNTLSNLTAVNFKGNQAQIGTVAVVDTLSTINMSSSVMYNNYGINGLTARSSLGSYSGSTFNIEHSTAVNNVNSDSFIQASSGTNLLNSYNNYFYNPQSGPWLVTFGASSVVNHDCQIVDANNNLSDAQYHLTTANAVDNDTLYFVDAANNDYHLSDTSALIDFTGLNCPSNLNLFNNGRDIDNQPRSPLADLGADENLSNHPPIFSDSFEN